jgi:hypothetical protein
MMNVVAKLEIIFSNRNEHKWQRMGLPTKVNTFHNSSFVGTLKPAYNGIPEDIHFYVSKRRLIKTSTSR